MPQVPEQGRRRGSHPGGRWGSREERLRRYLEMGGMRVAGAEAARRLEVTRRTICRYNVTLRERGQL
jgi:hypothetical protein